MNSDLTPGDDDSGGDARTDSSSDPDADNVAHADADADADGESPACGIDFAAIVTARCGPSPAPCADNACEAWRCEAMVAGDAGMAAMACDATTYFASTYSGFVASITASGAPAWTVDYCVGNCLDGAAGPPVVTDSGLVLVAVAPHEGMTLPPSSCEYPLMALNPDGTVAWRFSQEGASPFGSPVLDADGNIAVVIGGSLYSLSADGNLRWTAAPLASGRFLNGRLAASMAGTVYAAGESSVSAYGADGNELWVKDFGAEDWSILALALTETDDVVWAGGIPVDYPAPSVGGFVQEINPQGGVSWTARVSDDWVWEVLVAVDGSVVFRGRELGVLSSEGELLWTMSADRVDSGMLLTTEGIFVFIDGQATVLSLATGAVVRTLSLPAGSVGPALLSGQDLLVTNAAIGLIEMLVPLRLAEGGWPVAGGNSRRQGHRTGSCTL